MPERSDEQVRIGHVTSQAGHDTRTAQEPRGHNEMHTPMTYTHP
jgi:hypothetical protein